MRRTAVVALAIAGFPLLILALLAGAVTAVVLTGDRLDGSAFRLGFLGLVLIAGFTVATIAALRRRPDVRPGVDVTAEPELAALIRRLADLADTREPDRILVVDDVNAYVREQAGGRELYVGAQLFAGLTVSELASVLAHELGHYAHGDTRVAPVVRRATIWISTAADGVAGTLWWPLLRGYERVFHLATRAVSRRQEQIADRLSVAAAGRESAVGALRALSRIDGSWRAFDERYLVLPGGAREPVADVLEEFARFHRREPVRAAAPAPASRWDTHPTVEQRIRSLLALPPGASHLIEDDRPASRLIAAGGLDTLLAPGGPRESLAEVAQRRRISALEALAAPLGRAVRALSGRPHPRRRDLTALLGDSRLAERTRQEAFNGADVALDRRLDAVTRLGRDILPLGRPELPSDRKGAMPVRLGRAPYDLFVHRGLLWFWPVSSGDNTENIGDRLARRLDAIEAGTPGPQVIRLSPAQVAHARRLPGDRIDVELTVGAGEVLRIRPARYVVAGRREREWLHALRTEAQNALVRLAGTGGCGQAAEPFDASALKRAEWSRRAGTKRNAALTIGLGGLPLALGLLVSGEDVALLGGIVGSGTLIAVAVVLVVARAQRRKANI